MNFATRSQRQLQLVMLVFCASVRTQFAPYPQYSPPRIPCPGGTEAPCLPPLMPPPPPPPIPVPPPPMSFGPVMRMAQNLMAVPAGFAMIIPGDFSNGRRKQSTTTTSTTTTTTTTPPPPPRPYRIIPMIIPPPIMQPPPMIPPPPIMPGPAMIMSGPSMMMPSPMMFLNYRGQSKRRRKHSGRKTSGSSSSTSLSSSSSSSNEGNSSIRSKSDNVKKRCNTVTRRNILRAYHRVPEVGAVKPVLSYVAENGDVKFETKISNKEADKLLNDKYASIDFENDSLNRHEEPTKNVKVLTKHDGNNEKLIVYTEDEPAGSRLYSRRTFHRVKMGKSKQQYLHQGKKELIFNTPENRKITNMTLSFQVV